MGTPITGSGVTAATTPGRCAAAPAPAMSTRRPRSTAPRAQAIVSSGVRIADSARTSQVTPNSCRASAAWRITLRSESLPITIPTSGLAGHAGECTGTREAHPQR